MHRIKILTTTLPRDVSLSHVSELMEAHSERKSKQKISNNTFLSFTYNIRDIMKAIQDILLD